MNFEINLIECIKFKKVHRRTKYKLNKNINKNSAFMSQINPVQINKLSNKW